MSEELIIEEGVSPEDAALAQQFHAEGAGETPETPPEEGSEPLVVAQDDSNQNNEENAEGDNSSVEGHELTFKVKGEDKNYTKDQLQHYLSREQTFQQKYESLRNSEDYKQLVALQAAREGDKGAQKLILDQLKGMEEDLDSLSEVEETFDVDKKVEATSMEEAFSDVKGEVDYEETLDKISTNLKSKMPEKVWSAYNEDPVHRRTMYDLIKSGKDGEILNSVNEAINQLPLGERVKAKADPEFYGMLVVEVVNDLNAQQTDVGQTKDTVESAGVDSVSTGRSSHSQPNAGNAEIDWLDLFHNDRKEYERLSKKALGGR
jgi:hypothetical protein